MIALHVISGKSESVEEDTNIAAGITDTCYKMYHRQTLGLSPETVDLRSKSLHSNHPQYNQRPEVIESIFYMWRITHDPKYREWALNIAQSIEHATRLEGGYSGITNVYEDYDLHYNDLQDSFYIAETLKYLYLVFEADDFLNLDEWVLNTEAHLFKSRVLTYTESERDHDHAFEALSTLLQTMTTNHENHLQGLDGSSSEDASHNEEL